MKKWEAVWAIFFLTGFMFFTNIDLNNPAYEKPYFIWDKGKDILTVIAFLLLKYKDKNIAIKQNTKPAK